MEPRITYPAHLLSEHLAALLGGRAGALDYPAGAADLGRGVREVLAARHPLPGGTTLRLVAANSFDPAPTRGLPPSAVACLQIGTGAGRGYARGWVRGGDRVWRRAARLNVPGPAMSNPPLLHLEGGESPSTANEGRPAQGASRWSRTAGALGSGVYARAAGLSVGVVGLGRLGSLLARQLVRFGVRRLVVVDPDEVEVHNTGEGEFEPGQVGLAKVQAWAAQAARACPGLEVAAIRETVASLTAIEALKRCDVLFSAPDQPGARLAAGALAAVYCRPLIDLGTRVHRQSPTTMGADVRLVAPERCLLCLGGVADEARGLSLIESPDAEARFAAGRQWQQERPGSLASLNLAAVAIGLRMFEDFVAGRISSSLWCHAEFSANGELQAAYPAPPVLPDPAGCACAIAGWGDAGLGHFTAILRRRNPAPGEPRR